MFHRNTAPFHPDLAGRQGEFLLRRWIVETSLRAFSRQAAGLLALLLALLGAGSASAADWAKNFSALAGANTVTQATAVDATGNVYIAGYLTGASVTLGSVTLTRIGAQDAFVAKLDASGTVLWAKNYGGSGAQAFGFAIAVDGSGNVYVGGRFTNANLTTPALTKLGVEDAFAFKLDANGATTWAKNYGGSGAYANGSAIAVDGSGNVYLGGYFQVANLTTPALSKIGTVDAFAFKLDSGGATTWAKNYGGSGATAQANAIAVDGSGNVYLGGFIQSANLTTPALTKIGNFDAFAFKLDAAGATTWAKNYGGSGVTASAKAIAVDGSGNVYLGGSFTNANLTTPALSKIGTYDAFAFKLDAGGATTWAKNYGGSGTTAHGLGIAVDGSGNVYLGGSFTNANLTTPALSKIGVQDAFAFKLDSSGATTWSKNYGGSGATANGSAIAVDSSGNVYLGGNFTTANLTTPALSKIGATDAFAFKLDASGATAWARSYVGLTPGLDARVTATAVDSAGNTYIAGYFTNTVLQLGSVTLTRIGVQDAFAAKLDTSGTVLWAKNHGGSGATVTGSAIAVDASGNVYLGGYFNANLTTPALSKIGAQDAFAFKLDSSGATTWAKNYGGSGASTYGNAIAVDASGNVYLGGNFTTANLTTPALSKIGANDAFAFKLDGGGATTWSKNYGGSGAYAYGNAIAVDSSGNVVLGGYFTTANLTTPALTKIGVYDAFAFKLDTADGATTWAKNYGGNGAYAQTNGIAVDSSGNVYLGGYFRNANLTTPALAVIGARDAFAFKLDSGGATTWAKNFGGSGATTQGFAIAVDASSNVFLAGYYYGANLTTPALTKIGIYDAFAFKLNAAGATTWARSYGGSGVNAFGYAIAADSSGNMVLGGYFQGGNLTTPALTKGGAKDALVMRVLPATSPDAPTGISVTAGNAQATVAFTAPASNGGAAITSYTVTSSGGQTASGASSPLTVTGLTNGVAYTFTVTATNSAGTGSASSASSSITVGVAVASPTINEDTDSGAIAITGATNNYKITAISGGTLFSDNTYTTAINSGDFIATAGATTNVYFRPTANYNGAAGFSVQGSSSASDAGLTGNTAVSSITVTAVKDAPIGLGNLTLAAVEQGVTSPAGAAISALTGLNFTFVDAGSTLGGVAVVANLANAATQGAWQYSTDAGAHWFAIGAVADDNTALALSAATKVRFLPVASFSGTPTVLTVRALDNTYVAGYSVAAGTETRVTLNASVNGGATAIAANTNTISTSVTAPPAPVQNIPSPPTLPTGGGTAILSNGQSVTVTENGKDGTSIALPPPITTPPTGTTPTPGAPTSNSVNVTLPGTGTIAVSSDSVGTQLGVTKVTLPGAARSVNTVTVDKGSASFSASEKGQAMAGLSNGITIVSADKASKVSVDTTGAKDKIGGLTDNVTLVVPTGATNVGGTKVDLPPPAASGGKSATVNLNIGGHELTVTSSQSNSTMTFELKNIGGVQTPVLAVTGNAQITTSGEDKPIVSVGGNVIKSGKGSNSGGSRQVCNTIVQASSDANSDVVHVVTCYIVLEPGTFSALNGGVGNSFAAIKDGIVWAGETAEFDKNGVVISAYLGTREGATSAVGDDIVPGGNKFAANGFTNNAFIPRLTGSPLRLNEAKLDESLFSVFNTALNATTLPATPSQSAQGILNFQVNGGADSLQKAQAALTFDLVGDLVSVFPSKRIRVDTARADGISVSNEGNVEVATGGLVTTFVPTVADPQGFAADIATLFPGAVSEMRWNGSWKVTTSDGRMFVGRPQWGIQSSAAGNGFAALADGTVTYSANGRTQVLFPDFHDYTTLLATFSKELNDPNLKVAPRMNGSVQATVNGRTYLLYPQWTLLNTDQASGKPSWWLDNGVVYIKNADGTAQGFAVK